MPKKTTFNLLDPETFRYGHPHEAYDSLRSETPVYRHPGSEQQPSFWALTRHADIRAVSTDGENFSSTKGFLIRADTFMAMDPEIIAGLNQFMMAMDNPEHAKYRDMVSSAFTPAGLARIEARIRASVDALIEGLKERDEVDVVTEVAAIVPIKTVCAIMGVPQEDEWRVLEFTNAVFGIDDPDFSPSLDAANENYLAVLDYGWDLLEKRRRDPRDDVMSLIAHATIDGRPLTRVEQTSFFSNMISAGNETTRSSLGGAIWGLSQNPDQRQLLLDDPELIKTSLAELLRWYSPAVQMARTAKRDVEVGGTLIREGERVAMLHGAGNHDPAVFPDPHRLDLRRDNAQNHLSFGYGIHHCLGWRLALLQLQLILSAFLPAFPNYVATSEPSMMVSNFVHAMKSFKINLNG